MKTKIILAALFIFSHYLLHAQQSIKSTARPDSIIKIIPLESVDDVVYAYTIGGKLHMREDVIIRLKAYAPSAEEYHKSKTDITWGYISGGGFALSSFASVINFRNQSKNYVATMGASGRNYSGAYIFTGLASAFVGSAIINWVNGLKHFKKSIAIYNQRFE